MSNAWCRGCAQEGKPQGCGHGDSTLVLLGASGAPTAAAGLLLLDTDQLGPSLKGAGVSCAGGLWTLYHHPLQII